MKDERHVLAGDERVEPRVEQRLTVEALEQRILQSVPMQKPPSPAPYAPGAECGVVRRSNPRT